MSGSNNLRDADEKLKYEAIGATPDEIEKLKKLSVIRRTVLNSLKPDQDLDEKPSVIIDNFLYHGDLGHACSIDLLFELGINAIVNVCDCQIDDAVNENIDVLWKPVDDAFYVDIRQIFDEVFTFIEKCRTRNKRVLVHCQMGISRSAAVVIAYLMKTRNMPLEESMGFLIRRRPIIRPNIGFLLQLIRFENELTEKSKICQSKVNDGKKDSKADDIVPNQLDSNKITNEHQPIPVDTVHGAMESEQTKVDTGSTDELKNEENKADSMSSTDVKHEIAATDTTTGELTKDQLSTLTSASSDLEEPGHSDVAAPVPENSIPDEENTRL